MRKFLIATAILLFTAGCSTMDVNKYQAGTPEFILENYFEDKTVAYGVFENRSGEIVSQFKVTIDGKVENGQLILDEDFVYSDGTLDKRVWTIDILPEGKYQGTTDGVVGIAKGARAGNAFNWTYVFDLPVGDTSYKLKFDDWMFLQEDGVMINRAHVTKFGFRVGSVTLSFYKQS